MTDRILKNFLYTKTFVTPNWNEVVGFRIGLPCILIYAQVVKCFPYQKKMSVANLVATFENNSK